MDEKNQETRVKLGLNLNAKGFVQWEIVSEFPTIEDSEENLKKSLEAIKKIIAEAGYKEAGRE